MQEAVIEIEQSKLNIPTVKINQYYIHSKYNPLKEAEQFVQKNYSAGNLHIILGNGLGYYSEAFKEISMNGDDIIVFEPFKGLPESPLNFVFSDFKIFQQTLKEKLKQLKKLKVIAIPNYIKLVPDIHKDILNYAKNQLLVNKIFENTVNNFSQQWQENYLHNLLSTVEDYQIQSLEKRYNVPVIVAAAGPSLSKQISLLKQYRDRILLVAAGSSITALMKYNLEPDYVVTMDGGIANTKHFNIVKLSKAKLVYSLVTHPDVRKYVSSEKCYHYLSVDAYEMETHYTNLLQEKPLKLAGGGSVATYALSFARYVSSGPIALVGQDLAYTNNQSHDLNNRYSNGLSEEYIQRKDLFITKDVYGQDIYTDHAFMAMKEVFERLIEEVDDPQSIVNCTEGGLSIENIKNDTLQQFLSRYAINAFEYPKIEENSFDLSKEQLLEQLAIEIEQYDLAISLINENLNLLKSTESIRKFKPSVLTKMDKNEKRLFEITKRLSIAIALQKTMLKFMQADTFQNDDTEYIKYKKVYEKNELLYNELIAILQNTQQIIKKLISQ